MRRAYERTSRAAGVRTHRFRTAVVVFLLLFFAFAVGERAALATHSSSTIGLVAIDANSGANTATSLGPLDGCSRLEPGAQIGIDYVIDSIPQDRPMIGFEAEISYDPQLLEVVEVDYKLLLAAVGAHSPFAGRSEELPDTDGSFRLSVLDTASMSEPEANVERGAGVLARITLRAKAPGVSAVEIAVSRQPLVYPIVLDTQNELILVARIGSASLAVGQDCPVEAQQPIITEMAEVNEQIIADNPGLLGGATPASGAASPPAGQTPEGATPGGETPGDEIPEGETPTSLPTTVPCAAPPKETPRAEATPADATPSPAASPTDAPSSSPTPTEVVCTPTPTPIEEEIVDVEAGSEGGLMAGAAVLLTAGTAAAGSGWFLYRRSRNISPGA